MSQMKTHIKFREHYHYNSQPQQIESPQYPLCRDHLSTFTTSQNLICTPQIRQQFIFIFLGWKVLYINTSSKYKMT